MSGPFEYVVFGTSGDHLHEVLGAELNRPHAGRAVRVVDLAIVTRDVSGTLTVHEIDDLLDTCAAIYDRLDLDLEGVLSPNDIEAITTDVPAATCAIVILFEHRWAHDLARAVASAGGTFHRRGTLPAGTLSAFYAMSSDRSE